MLSLFALTVCAIVRAAFKTGQTKARGAFLATAGFILVSFVFALVEDLLVQWRRARLRKARAANRNTKSD